MYSFAAVHNYLGTPRALCRWKCVYKTASGQLHVNAGARNVAPGEVIGLNHTKKDITTIVAKVDGAGSASCVEAKDPRK
jgi:hypothetical protein